MLAAVKHIHDMVINYYIMISLPMLPILFMNIRPTLQVLTEKLTKVSQLQGPKK